MASAVSIANFALDRIGISESISDLSESTQRAKTCARWFDQCRDEVLRDFIWPFACVTEPLAIVAGQTWTGWTYVYQYPINCLRVISIGDERSLSGMQYGVGGLRYGAFWDDSWGGAAQRTALWEVKLKADGASQVLVSVSQNAWVHYVKRVTNTGVYPPDFVSTLAWKLASEIGGPLKADASLVRAAQQAYEFQRQRAAANAQNEQLTNTSYESPSITARY